MGCPDCLVELVEDPAATVRCRHCGRDWPASMDSCPNCLAELQPDPGAAAEALASDGTLLFRLDGYPPAEDALVAFGADGAPRGTYLKAGRRVEVRDETSAPVAALRPAGEGYELVETGGEVLARCRTEDVQQGVWVDDRWWLEVGAGALPLRPLAAVTLLLAAKVLLGRASPSQVWEGHREVEGGWPTL